MKALDAMISITSAMILFMILAIIIFLASPPAQGECGIPSGHCIINGTEMPHYCMEYPECMDDNSNCTWQWSWFQKLKCP